MHGVVEQINTVRIKFTGILLTGIKKKRPFISTIETLTSLLKKIVMNVNLARWRHLAENIRFISANSTGSEKIDLYFGKFFLKPVFTSKVRPRAAFAVGTGLLSSSTAFPEVPDGAVGHVDLHDGASVEGDASRGLRDLSGKDITAVTRTT